MMATPAGRRVKGSALAASFYDALFRAGLPLIQAVIRDMAARR